MYCLTDWGKNADISWCSMTEYNFHKYTIILPLSFSFSLNPSLDTSPLIKGSMEDQWVNTGHLHCLWSSNCHKNIHKVAVCGHRGLQPSQTVSGVLAAESHCMTNTPQCSPTTINKRNTFYAFPSFNQCFNLGSRFMWTNNLKSTIYKKTSVTYKDLTKHKNQ